MASPGQGIFTKGRRQAALTAAAMLTAYGAVGLWGSLLGLLPLVLYMLGGHLLGRGLSRAARVHLFLALLMVAIVAAAVTERPATLGNLAWVVLVPMVATLMLGNHAGWLWVGLGFASMAASVVMIRLGGLPTFEVSNPLVFQTLRFGVILLAVFLFAREARDHLEALRLKAQAADDAKSVFLANISHEIRTPLNGVLGMTDALLSRELPPAAREDLEVVHRSGAMLLRLLNDLLDLTKAERGQLEVERIPLDLDLLLRDVTQCLHPKEGVRLRLETKACGPVLGDPTRLRQVLINLLSNAAKFTVRGEIVLRVDRPSEERFVFEVIDSGPGMTPETLAALFKPFKQANASIARQFGGTGLGLALVKSLTHGMGGEVTVSSTLGAGTTFRVCLPLPPAVLARVAEVQAPNLRHVTLLVVDDNPINLRVASAMLQRLHCQVVTAETGEAAVALASARPFDLVLMDCQLPGIDGWEATRRVHAIPGRERLPIIALTASASRADVERCHEAGMAQVLAKPLVFADLCRALEPLDSPAAASG
jgi:signal transduction histidine kinase/CheY-like chemotaxis protein